MTRNDNPLPNVSAVTVKRVSLNGTTQSNPGSNGGAALTVPQNPTSNARTLSIEAEVFVEQRVSGRVEPIQYTATCQATLEQVAAPPAGCTVTATRENSRSGPTRYRIQVSVPRGASAVALTDSDSIALRKQSDFLFVSAAAIAQAAVTALGTNLLGETFTCTNSPISPPAPPSTPEPSCTIGLSRSSVPWGGGDVRATITTNVSNFTVEAFLLNGSDAFNGARKSSTASLRIGQNSKTQPVTHTLTARVTASGKTINCERKTFTQEAAPTPTCTISLERTPLLLPGVGGKFTASVKGNHADFSLTSLTLKGTPLKIGRAHV